MAEDDARFKYCRPFLLVFFVMTFLFFYQQFVTNNSVNSVKNDVSRLFKGEEPTADSVWKMVLAFIIIQLVLSWITDSYAGRMRAIYFYYFLSIFSSILLVFRSLNFGGEFTYKIWIVSRFILLAQASVLCAFTVTQLQLPQNQSRLHRWVTLIVWSRPLGRIVAWSIQAYVVASLKSFMINALTVSAIDFLCLCILLKKKSHVRTMKPKFMAVETTLMCLFVMAKGKIVTRKRREGRQTERNDWAEYVRNSFDEDAIEITRRFIAVLKISAPLFLLILTSDYIQHHTFFQEKLMKDNMAIREFTVEIIRELSALAAGPTVIFGLSPIMKKLKCPVKEIPLLTVGYGIIFLSYICVLFLQGVLDRNKIIFPRTGYAEIRLYNSLPHSIEMKSKLFNDDDEQWTPLSSLSVFAARKIRTTGRLTEPAQVRVNSTVYYFVLVATENEATAYVVQMKREPMRFYGFEPVKSILTSTNSTCYVICTLTVCERLIVQIGSTKFEVFNDRRIHAFSVDPGKHVVRIYKLIFLLLEQKYEFQQSSVSSLLIYKEASLGTSSVGLKIFDIQQSSDLLVIWSLPQIILQAVGEFFIHSIIVLLLLTQSPNELMTLCMSFLAIPSLVGFAVYRFVTEMTMLKLAVALLVFFVSLFLFAYVVLYFPYREWSDSERTVQKKEGGISLD